MPNVPAAAREPIVGIVITLVLVGLLLIPVFGVWRYGRRSRRRELDILRRERQLPERSAGPRRTSAWTYLLLILGLGLVFWYFAPKKVGHDRPPPAPVTGLGWVVLVPIAFLACWVGFVWLRSRDALIRRATRLAKAGDRAGAVALLTEAIELQPTGMRANHLACLLMEQQDWAGAYKSMLQAKELGVPEVLWRNNMGVALRNLGRFADAIELVEPRAGRKDANLVEVCTYGEALIDAGRLDDAWEQIRRAEEMLTANSTRVVAGREVLRKMIDHCRTRYEERAAKKDAGPVGPEIL